MHDCRCVVDREVIDEINILQATLLAMRRAVDQLKPSADFVLVDGQQLPQVYYAVTNGITICMCITSGKTQWNIVPGYVYMAQANSLTQSMIGEGAGLLS